MNVGNQATSAEVASACDEHDLELLAILSKNRQGSRFVARVRTANDKEAILKHGRPTRPGERIALTAWTETGASARLMSDYGNDLLLIELLDGESLGVGLEHGHVDLVAIGQMLHQLHQVGAVDGLQPVGLDPGFANGWMALSVAARQRAAAAITAILMLEPAVTLHGDIGLLNVMLTSAGPKVFDPAGLSGPAALDVAQLAVVVFGRTGRRILDSLIAGYGGTPRGLADAATFFLCLYYNLAVERHDDAMAARLKPLVDSLDNDVIASLSNGDD